MTSIQPAESPLESLLTRIRATDAEARRILGHSSPSELPPIDAPRHTEPVRRGELPPWSDVELELTVTEDLVTFVGRDLVTGKPRIKVMLAQDDATEEWIPWIRRWLERKRRGSLQLVE